MSVIKNETNINLLGYMNIPMNYNDALIEELKNTLRSSAQEEEPTVFDAVLPEPPSPQMQHIVDSAVHLLGSKQDVVHTVHRLLEDREEWDLAVMDGHGSSIDVNPYTGKYESYNLTLAIIQEMMGNGKLDEIMARDIYSQDDPAVEFQRYLSKKCIEFKLDMTNSGATFSLIQIRHDFTTKKITVNVLTVGDSPVTIHVNGQKVMESVAHDWKNADEMERLCRDGRLNPEGKIPSNSFKFLDKNTLMGDLSYYICAGPCQLAMTQSIGHIEYALEKVADETGVFGLAPFKSTMVFDETDEINIKGYSDGVSDIVVDYLSDDAEFLRTSNATQTADYAKMKWQKDWVSVSRILYERAVKFGRSLDFVPKSKLNFGNTADDVCCVSWIQTKV